MSDKTKYLLEESKMPKTWYNITADLPKPLSPVLHPGTLKPVGPDDLAPLFPMALIGQEVSEEREIEIPEPIRDIYKQWRPSPLYRARRLEKALDTTAKIYYKYEGVSPTGSHKPNTAVAQAFYNKEEGTKKITTETGAGQWGSSLAFACSIFKIELDVYMVKVSFEQKPYRKMIMETFGARCFASPSNETKTGKAILEKDPNNTGSLGIAISEAVEMAAQSDTTKYSLGSVLNHVLMHQTIVGKEAILQMEMAGDYPDILVGCTGGGSNFSGLAFPFLEKKFREKKDIKIIACEPKSCPSLTKGKFAYDFGDTEGFTPMMLQYTLGHDFMPPGIHAGGLRYHGASSLVSQMYHEKLIEAVSVPQVATFEAGVQFARAEGIIPAPESNHAIRACIDEALRCKESGEEKTLFFNLSGHGHFDMVSYDKYFTNKLEDYDYPQSEIDAALERLPKVKA